MQYGLALPSLGDDATREGIEAAAETAERLGFADIWVTDHLLVDASAAEDYGRIFEAVTTLAYLAGRTTKVRLGASVIVVPMRNAVVLAKELATIDVLSRGRLTVGVGVGWSAAEFGNVGVPERMRERGAYTDETVRVWRHLWSGATWPFHGRFHTFDDFVFGPLPDQGGDLPIWIGGRQEAALRRVGRLADAYHSSADPAERLRAPDPDHPGRRGSGRSPDARAECPGPRPPRVDRTPATATPCAARPRRSPPRSGPSPRSASAICSWLCRAGPGGTGPRADRFMAEIAPLV